MKEYGELSYLGFFKECQFVTRGDARTFKGNGLEVLNKLSRFGWKLVHVKDDKYLLERDVK